MVKADETFVAFVVVRPTYVVVVVVFVVVVVGPIHNEPLKVLIGRVVKFSYLKENKRERESLSGYLGMKKESYVIVVVL